MNKVMLTGRLVSDPIVRYTNDSKMKVTFNVGINRKASVASVKQDIISCFAFNGLAKVCEEYLKKGKLIAVVGYLRNKEFGPRKGDVEIVIDNLQLMDEKKEGIK